MAKYIFIYHGGDLASNPKKTDEIQKQWDAWYESMGSSLEDPGKTFEPDSKSSSDIGGYSILNVTNLEEAENFANISPHVRSGGSIEIREIL